MNLHLLFSKSVTASSESTSLPQALASHHAASLPFHNTTASGPYISAGSLCHIPRQLTALPLRRVTLSACHFSDNSSSQPFHHQPFHQSTALNCPCGTVSQSTTSPINFPRPFPVYNLPRHRQQTQFQFTIY